MQSLTHADLHRIADEVFEDLGTESTAHARRPLALIYAAVTLSRLFHPNEERAKSEKQTVTLFRLLKNSGDAFRSDIVDVVHVEPGSVGEKDDSVVLLDEVRSRGLLDCGPGIGWREGGVGGSGEVGGRAVWCRPSPHLRARRRRLRGRGVGSMEAVVGDGLGGGVCEGSLPDVGVGHDRVRMLVLIRLRLFIVRCDEVV